MFGPIVDHVAALAEGREVGVGVVGGVVIPMGSSQHNSCSVNQAEDVGPCRDPYPPAPAIAPSASLRVPPAPVAEVVDHPPMRSSAALAAAPSPTEPDHGRELCPVDGVEEAMLGPDRHGAALCHRA